MSHRAVRTLLVLGFLCGLAGGFVAAAAALSAQRYLAQGRWRLAWLTLLERLDRGALIGLAAAVLVIALGAVFRFVGKKAIAPYWTLDVRTTKLPPLLRVVRRPFMRSGRAAASFIRRFAGSDDGPPKRPVALAAVLIGMNLALPARDVIAPVRGPNILLVVADALRPDRLGCYGSTAGLSPNIDAAAAESLVFDDAMSSAPWTKPSIGSLFTSYYPHEHGAYDLPDRLNGRFLTLAEAFRDGGYATFGVQKNACIGPAYDFGQGFEAYVDTARASEADMLRIVERRIETAGRRPFFAYVHFMNTHVPFISEEAFDPKFVLGHNFGVDIRILTELGLAEADKDRVRFLYDRSVAAFDSHFGTLLAMLRERGLEGRTIVILTADHGEELWDHGYFEHGHTLYNEILKVPLVVRAPGRFPPGRVPFRVQNLDLYPFLLRQADLRIPAGIRGRDFTAGLSSGKFAAREDWYFEGMLFGQRRKAVIRGRWKLIENFGAMRRQALPWFGEMTPYLPPPEPPPFELYDLETDPGERENVAAIHPEIVRALKRRIDLFMTTFPGVPSAASRTMTEKEKDKLRSLGYIK